MKELLIDTLVVHQRYHSRRILFVSVIINLLTILACLFIVACFYPSLDNNLCPNDSEPLFPNGLDKLKLNNEQTIYDFNLKSFEFRSSRSDRILLQGSFARQIDLTNDYKRVVISKTNDNNHRVKFYPKPRAPEIELEVKTGLKDNDNIVCSSFKWQTRSNSQVLEDCIDLTGVYWFGQSEAYTQYWPINNSTTNMEYRPYLSGLFDDYSSVIERYWLATSGAAVIVDQAVPLFVQKNQTDLCLRGSSLTYLTQLSFLYIHDSVILASNNLPYSERKVFLSYDVCQIDPESSPKDYLNQLHLYVIGKYFKKPSGLPDLRMLKSPIWSTWAVYKKEINNNLVLEYARNIIINNYTNSQLEIDDKFVPLLKTLLL